METNDGPASPQQLGVGLVMQAAGQVAEPKHRKHLEWKMRRMWRKALTLNVPKDRQKVRTNASLTTNTK